MVTATEDNRVRVRANGNEYKSERLIGYRVSYIRSELGGSLLDIGSDTVANVNSEPVDESYVAKAGDKIVFARAAGTKG